MVKIKPITLKKVALTHWVLFFAFQGTYAGGRGGENGSK